MSDIHRLVKRQFKKCFGDMENVSKQLSSFMEAISSSYKHYESDRILIERTMEMSSAELTESNKKLVEESKKHQLLFKSLKESIKDISVDDTEVDNDDLLRIADTLKTEISKRKNAEQEIALREEKYRNIIENMELGMIETDLEGKIINTYDTFCSMLGYTKDEILGKHTSDLLYDNSNKQLIKIQNDKRSDGSFGVHEVQLMHKNGEKVWMIVSAAQILDPAGDIYGSVEIHFDITHRKKIEADLVQARELAERSLKSKDLFLANMSHEIRTPMNAIIGMSRLMEDTPLTNDQIDYQKAIQSSSEGLLVIINDILDMSKISAGKFTVEEIDFELDPLLDHLVKSLSFRADEKDIYLRIHKHPSINRFLKGDPTRLNQVLVNLTGNAIKFTQKGGVDIKIDLIESLEGKDIVEFAVQDSGIGIEEDRLHKIFDSFTQEDVSTSRRFGGTGLGLTISRELVKAFGGDLSVASVKNEGSTFSFILEMEHGEIIQKQEKSKDTDKDLSSMSILLVEDNEINRFLATTVLTRWNAKVDTAVNGLEAIEKVNQTNYNIILMDMQMPEMDGIEATQEIRNTLKLDLPIIALTANAIKGEKEKCLEAGMDGYVSKPFSPDELYEKIVELTHFDLSEASEVLAMGESAAYSLERLSMLCAGDSSSLKKTINIFLNQFEKAIDMMNESIQNEDYSTINRLAHKMKPDFDLFEIDELKENLRAIEKNAKLKNKEALTMLIQELTNNSVEILKEMKKEVI